MERKYLAESESDHNYFFSFPKGMPWAKYDELGRRIPDVCKHSWMLVWLSEDLEGFRCKLCGKEVIDLEEEYYEKAEDTIP